MTIPHSLARAARDAVQTSPILQDPAALRARNRPQLRRYDVTTLLPNGDIAETRHIAPALPLFEDTVSAFTRGSLVMTEQGPVAIEDLLPGDTVLAQDGTSRPIMWKGSTTMLPGRPGSKGRDHRLTSFMADSFGMQKPLSCVIAGPSARLLRTPMHLKAIAGDQPMLTPVQEFRDGMNVVEAAPPTPVQLFHICLDQHAVIQVGGLEFETYHPGINTIRTMSQAMRSLFLNMFTHVRELSDFGTQLFPRAGDGKFDALSA